MTPAEFTLLYAALCRLLRPGTEEFHRAWFGACANRAVALDLIEKARRPVKLPRVLFTPTRDTEAR
jgi:hypothetical protein